MFFFALPGYDRLLVHRCCCFGAVENCLVDDVKTASGQDVQGSGA